MSGASKMNKQHAERLSSLNCICCDLLGQRQVGRTCIHHIRSGKGMAQRAGDYLTIPLCQDCHQGSCGIHGDKTYLKILKMTELDLLNETLKQVWRKAND